MHSASTIGAAARRKIECLLFAAAFFAYGYFHQGGGWAQNARFAMVRALVEQCTYSIDHYLIYMPAETVGGEKLMVRVPVSDATFELGGRTYALMSHDAAGREALINSRQNRGRYRQISIWSQQRAIFPTRAVISIPPKHPAPRC